MAHRDEEENEESIHDFDDDDDEESNHEFYYDEDDSCEHSSTESDDDDIENEGPFDSELSENHILPSKDTIKLHTFQCIVVLSLILICAAVAGAAYQFLYYEEIQRFGLFSRQTINSMSDSIEYRSMGIAHEFESFSEAITSYSLDTNKQWPFVTVPHFEIRANTMRLNTMTEVIAIAPIIDNTTIKKQWEKYAFDNQNWLHDDSQIMDIQMGQNQNQSSQEEEQQRRYISPLITKFVQINSQTALLPDTSPGPFVPIWQVSPVPVEPAIINLNLLTNPELAVPITQTIQRLKSDDLSTPQSLLTDQAHLGTLYNTIISANQHNKLHDIINTATTTTASSNLRSANDYPHSFIFHPIYDTFDIQDRSIVAFVIGILQWDWFFSGVLPQGVNGIFCVLRNSCGQIESFMINGHDVQYLGPEDKHEVEYDDLSVTLQLPGFRGLIGHNMTTNINNSNNSSIHSECLYSITMTPSSTYKATHESNRATTFTAAMAVAFIVTVLVFWSYVRYVQKQNNIIMATAIHTSRIVSSLFPSNVRARIMEDAEKKAKKEHDVEKNEKRKKRRNRRRRRFRMRERKHTKDEISKYMTTADGERTSKQEGGIEVFERKPIADLFPNCTVLFADIVGFTAWSSVREPTQVFQLLETLFHSFDEAARKRRVFKVETVGDCYVAVTGLPDPRKDHAVAMARFADESLIGVLNMVKKLETMLGPGTAELSMRFGMHSGAVTAGVLRGEKSRFQLFGDTVNTAARMESNGARGRIHISQETADLLVAAGKSMWIKPRDDKIVAKGKGEMQTFWLNLHAPVAASPPKLDSRAAMQNKLFKMGSSVRNMAANTMNNLATNTMRMSFRSGSNNDLKGTGGQPNNVDIMEELLDNSHEDDATDALHSHEGIDEVQMRMIDWVGDLLEKLLKQICAHRRLQHGECSPNESDILSFEKKVGDTSIFEEANAVISFPSFQVETSRYLEDCDLVSLSAEVKIQLIDFVTTIATLYHDNEYHNFARTSHVTMAVMKFISRLNSQEDGAFDERSSDNDACQLEERDEDIIAEDTHIRTFGLSSDPLSQFGIMFAALILDVDHSGVSNSQLVKENTVLAKLYNNQSILEQNSVELAWSILMDPRYETLRHIIYTTEEEFRRFRRIVVKTVLATDMEDVELQKQRNMRWDHAFVVPPTKSDPKQLIDERASLVVEHLIQASVISHTLQHWTIFRKWTEKAYKEEYYAHLNGRSLHNPEEYWYDGQMTLFERHAIPVASKLKESGVLGAFGDEYLDCAIQNQSEWEYKGQVIVNEIANEMDSSEGKSVNSSINNLRAS